MIDVRTFAKLFNFIVLYYDKFREALEELRYVEYYEDTRKIYAVFKNDDNEKYEAFYDAMNYSMSCDCKGYLLRKRACKHIRLLALFAHTNMNLPLSYMKLGRFRMRWHKHNETYEYIIAKGRIIAKKVL